MSFSIYYLLVGVIVAANLADAVFECQDRHCFVTVNDQKENIFDCALGKAQDDLVKCTYNPRDRILILTTNDESFVKIKKIAPNAFKRISQGIAIHRFFFNKFQVDTIDSHDFNGLSQITELGMENPKSLAFNTFLSMQSRINLILSISCSQGNSENSFSELYMNTNSWRLFSTNCNKLKVCEYSSCGAKGESKITRIIATNQTNTINQLHISQCTHSRACTSNSISTKKIPKQGVNLFTSTVQPGKSSKLKAVSLNSSYDTLMWIVLFLTGINSIVILGILLFLIVWWKKFTNSSANKKHTIILDDGEDTKYLKLSPHA